MTTKKGFQELLKVMKSHGKVMNLPLLFETIIDKSDAVETWINPEAEIYYITSACFQLTGYKNTEILENPALMEKIVFPEDRTFWAKEINRAIQSRDHKVNYEFRIITKDGIVKRIETSWYPLKDIHGSFYGWRAITKDITDRRQLEEKYRITQTRYQAILDCQTELIVRHKIDSTITYINKAFASFADVGTHGLIGQKWFASMPPDIVSQIQTMIKAMTPENPSAAIELQNMRHDGASRWIHWISTGIFGKDGDLIELQVVGHDITEHIVAEQSLEKALHEVEELKQQLETENIYLKDMILPRISTPGVIANSDGMKQVLEKVHQVAATDTAVLITGETGTGKELIARMIHQMSKRSNKLMITVNCAALPASLIESELFGREKGAYTGALTRQAGRFEIANHSTIFLDEIGEMPLELQVKLLRILQFGEFERIGSPETHKTNVRIIAATNKDLKKAQDEGMFRKDLYYRLNVFPIHIPPLRDRLDDVAPLVWTFVNELVEKTGKRIDTIPRKVMEKLTRYSWPGNVRELRNVIEHAMIITTSRTLDIALPTSYLMEDLKVSTLEEMERIHILAVLKQTHWRVRGEGGAAQILGLNEATLRFRMKKLGIMRPE